MQKEVVMGYLTGFFLEEMGKTTTILQLGPSASSTKSAMCTY
jgi:hypothetical protein